MSNLLRNGLSALMLVGATLTVHTLSASSASTFSQTLHPSGIHLTAYKPAPPTFHLAWKMEIAEAARSAAVGDVTGDGKPRLVLLVEKPQQSGLATLMVKKWNGTTFATEFSGDVDAAPDKLAVGKFAGPDKPAVIVTADALWIWNGTTFVRKPAPRPVSIFGVARMKSGTERLIISESATVFKSYMVDPQAANDWLTDRTEAPKSSDVNWEQMRASAAFFHEMGMPPEFGDGGLITLWDPHKADAPLLFYSRVERPVDSDQKFICHVAFRDPTRDLTEQNIELWTSSKLSGVAYDMAISDARVANKPGLLILTSDAASGKSRTLYFYAMD